MQTVHIFLLPLDDLLLVEFLDELLAIAQILLYFSTLLRRERCAVLNFTDEGIDLLTGGGSSSLSSGCFVNNGPSES